MLNPDHFSWPRTGTLETRPAALELLLEACVCALALLALARIGHRASQ